MSYTAFPSSPEENFDTIQNHDRIHRIAHTDINNATTSPYTIPQHNHHHQMSHQHDNRLSSSSSSSDSPSSAPVSISAKQRMIAACSGSLLTSLLVTPLDVVRVRLQSQQPNSTPWTSNTTSLSSAASSFPRTQALRFQSFSFPTAAHLSRPLSELGVTTCCREVFWVPTTNELCVAGPLNFTSTSNAMESCVAEQTSRRTFTGTWEGLVKIARYEGLTSLYRGLSPTLLMAIPANVIYFTGYDALRYSQKSPLSRLSDTSAPLVAGSVARTLAATIIAPLELFRTKLQATSIPTTAAGSSAESSITAFRETADNIRSMVAQNGMSSLWRGLTLTLWRDVPFSGFYWWGYEATRHFLTQERYGRMHALGHIERHQLGSEAIKEANDEATFTDSFIAGSVSGAIASVITQPFDVGKTRRQVTSTEGSMPNILYNIFEKEGVRGLFKGVVPRMLKVAPACAIMISSYEIGKKAAVRMNEKKDHM